MVPSTSHGQQDALVRDDEPWPSLVDHAQDTTRKPWSSSSPGGSRADQASEHQGRNSAGKHRAEPAPTVTKAANRAVTHRLREPTKSCQACWRSEAFHSDAGNVCMYTGTQQLYDDGFDAQPWKSTPLRRHYPPAIRYTKAVTIFPPRAMYPSY